MKTTVKPTPGGFAVYSGSYPEKAVYRTLNRAIAELVALRLESGAWYVCRKHVLAYDGYYSCPLCGVNHEYN